MCNETKRNEHDSATGEQLAQLLKGMNTNHMAFVSKRVWAPSDAEAARECGVSPETVKRWKYDGVPIDEVVRLMKCDGVIVAVEMFRRALVDADAVKVAGLTHRNELVRQAAANDIIDRNLGKPMQRQELSGQVTVVWNAGQSSPFGLQPEVDSEAG